MGFSPAQVGACSAWELMSAYDGWGLAQGATPLPTHKPWSIEKMRQFGIEGA